MNQNIEVTTTQSIKYRYLVMDYTKICEKTEKSTRHIAKQFLWLHGPYGGGQVVSVNWHDEGLRSIKRVVTVKKYDQYDLIQESRVTYILLT